MSKLYLIIYLSFLINLCLIPFLVNFFLVVIIFIFSSIILTILWRISVNLLFVLILSANFLFWRWNRLLKTAATWSSQLYFKIIFHFYLGILLLISYSLPFLICLFFCMGFSIRYAKFEQICWIFPRPFESNKNYKWYRKSGHR